MTKTLVILMAFLTIGTTQAQGELKKSKKVDRSSWTTADFWKEASVDFDRFVTNNISNKSCSQNVRVLIACMDSLSVGLEFIEGDGAKLIEYRPGSVEEENAFYPFKISTIKNKGVEEVSRLRESSYLKLYAMDKLLDLSKVNVEPLVEKIKANVEEESSSYLTATMFNALIGIANDPHSYMAPKLRMQAQSKKSDKKKLIGIGYEPTDNGLFVTSVMEGSPAKKAGLLLGDLIISVNGETEALASAIGSYDSLDLRIKRDESVIEKSLEKGEIVIKNVNVELMESDGENYIYISLKTFMDNTSCSTIKQKSQELLEATKVDGVILDLRNNGGGHVTQGMCLVSLFIEDGSTIWVSEFFHRNQTEVKKIDKTDNIFGDLHTVTLVNGYSASASESTAIFLKDYRKSFIVGETTFGKGTMQSMSADRYNPYIVFGNTVARFFGPKGISPQLIGVQPDFEVYPQYGQKEPTKFVREKDRYLFPIPANATENHVAEDRKEEIKTVGKCIEDNSKIASKIESLDEILVKHFDMQLERAKEVLKCANENVGIFKRIDIENAGGIPALN